MKNVKAKTVHTSTSLLVIRSHSLGFLINAPITKNPSALFSCAVSSPYDAVTPKRGVRIAPYPP